MLATIILLTGITLVSARSDDGSSPIPGSTLMGNYLAGRYAQMEGDMRAAAKYLSAALSLDGENISLKRRVFLVCLADGQYKKAVDLAKIIISQMPNDQFSLLTLIAHDFKIGQFVAAREKINKLGADGINSYLNPLLQAWSYVGSQNTASAIKSLDPLNKTNSTLMLYNAHAALIHTIAGNAQRAEQHFLSLLETQNGLSLRATELLGAHYEWSGFYEKAIELYDNYNTTDGNYRIIMDLQNRAEQRALSREAFMTATEGASEAFLDLTGSLRQQNARETGLLLSRLGLYLKPSFPTFQLMTGTLLEELGRYKEANDMYSQIDPESGYAWNAQLRITTNLDILGETEKAILLLRQLANDNPEDVSPLIDLGDVLRGTERFRDAIMVYNEAFDRLPEESLDQYWSLFYARGIAHERAKNWLRAEADLLQALSFKPDQPYILNYLGYSWIEKGTNLDRAKEMIERAVNLRPHDGYIVDSLGWAYYQLGEYESAVSELERAVELTPEDPIINDHLGDAYWRVGRFREAKFQWRRSLSLNPDSSAATITQDKISNGIMDQPNLNDNSSL